MPKLYPVCSRRLQVTEIPAHEPARIGGTRKMRPFKTGWEITMLILRDFLRFGREGD